MTTARDIAWALACSFLVAGGIFATCWIWIALGRAILGVR